MIGKDLSNEEKLNEIYKLTEENNRILHNMRRGQFVANFFRTIYWVVIIVSLGGAYYLVKPIVATFSTGNGSGLSETIQELSALKANFSELKAIQKALGENQPASTSSEGGQ
jgi:hypothetical protein